MATITSVGGVQYIGDAPAGETIHEHDTEINKDQIITSAVFAGPITFAATVTVTGTAHRSRHKKTCCKKYTRYN